MLQYQGQQASLETQQELMIWFKLKILERAMFQLKQPSVDFSSQSAQALHGLDEAHPGDTKHSALVSLPIRSIDLLQRHIHRHVLDRIMLDKCLGAPWPSQFILKKSFVIYFLDNNILFIEFQ